MKIFAMSDIHGCVDALDQALQLVDLSGENMVVFLGDYIHGPDNYGVLDRIIGLQEKYGRDKAIALLGNHEEMAVDGEWPINGDQYDAEKDKEYLKWMNELPRYYVAGNVIFVHAGIDEECAANGYWELGTMPEIFTKKYPPEKGKISNFNMKIVAGHVGTAEISGDPDFHDVYFDGGSHYYIDGTVYRSGVIPVLMMDTETDKYYCVSKKDGLRPIFSY